ncbi:hypothetical protein BWQ96_05988 [Gracilariopsis chorda]|uniref:Uncharacterized protein n=1 Tax=Gracilariopsis chorda TaxID=448386 RepID=A0A2V3IQE8_9FLOR|nr:hypothetical protein BWQ96_05988 [Gracilariopsis chorda]|eukprot:PXF44284.1 hypothetical protein BWQ96_05988 [Gracilariopsis chorda]
MSAAISGVEDVEAFLIQREGGKSV